MATRIEVDRSQLLVSLAILKTNSDERGRSYIDNFVPFVTDWMIADGGASFAPEDVSAGVQDRYALRFPVGVARTLLGRVVHLGLGHMDHGRFIPNAVRLAGRDLTQKRDQARRQQNALTDRLRAYAESNHTKALTEPQAVEALLRHIDEHSVSLLRSMATAEPYQPSQTADSELDYIVSAFVIQVFDRDPEGFKYLEGIVQGSMIASTLYLPNIAEVEKRFERTTAYFDTRILLRALGFEGPEIAASVREAFDLAYGLGAKLACFEHTFAEIQNVINSAAASMGRRRSGAPMRSVEAYFVANAYKASDVELLIESLPAKLQALRIRVMERPEHVKRLTLDEPVLDGLLQEKVGYRPEQDAARLHDLNSITSIYRLRNGESQKQLENCRALFVTTNTPLVRATREFFADQLEGWPLVLVDHDFTTLTWLKRPLAAPNLPRLQVIADCHAAIEPSPSMWLQFVREIELLQERGDLSEQSYYVLRFSPEARRALMDHTLGDVRKLSSETIKRVLESATAELQKPIAARLTTAERSRADAEAKERETAEYLSAAEGMLNRLVNDEHLSARSRGARVGHIVFWGVFALTASAIALSVWASLPSSWPMSPPHLPASVQLLARTVVGLGAILGVILAVLGPTLDITAIGVARSLEVRAAQVTEKWFLRRSRVIREVGTDSRGNGASFQEPEAEADA